MDKKDMKKKDSMPKHSGKGRSEKIPAKNQTGV